MLNEGLRVTFNIEHSTFNIEHSASDRAAYPAAANRRHRTRFLRSADAPLRDLAFAVGLGRGAVRDRAASLRCLAAPSAPARISAVLRAGEARADFHPPRFSRAARGQRRVVAADVSGDLCA